MTKTRAVLALLALAAALFTIGVSAPVQADFNPCPDGPHAPPCTDYILWEPDPFCGPCPEWGLGLYESEILAYDARWRYIDDVRGGLNLLDLASRAQDPDLIGQLRGQALKKFLTATFELQGATVKPGTVGVYDRTTGEVRPDPMSWLVTADQAIAGGLNSLTFGTPTPEPAIALKPFEEALAALAQAG